MPQFWTLKELADESARYLEQGDSQRIRWKPNGRQIRYYATLGILDKPSMVGKKAFYGPKHLLQLLSIKHLQHQDLKLAEIQAAMLGASIDQMLKLVGFDQQWYDDLESRIAEKQVEGDEPEDRRSLDFWTQRPSVRTTTTTTPTDTQLRSLLSAEIAPGISLVLDLEESDLAMSQAQELSRILKRAYEQYQKKDEKE